MPQIIKPTNSRDTPKKTPNSLKRHHASYYVKGVPLIEDAHIVYMNFDGFAYYYYDEFIKRSVDSSMPTLKKLLSEGVTFENLRNTLPSITNPCQNMILSGSTSMVTKNVYRYFNIKTNTVVQQGRENANKTIADVAIEAGFSVASVSHYLLEPLLTKNLPYTYYIEVNNAASGGLVKPDGIARFDQLIALIKGETVNVRNRPQEIKYLPRFTAFYVDDLDALGHNEVDFYNYEKKFSEAGRLNNVIKQLKILDDKLKELIEASIEKGIYDKLTFFLTTDHGMSPFGLESLDDKSEYGISKLNDLKKFIEQYSDDYIFEMLPANASPNDSTTVVGVGANLNVQLTWKKKISDEELTAFKEKLEQLYYVGVVMTRQDLNEIGYMEGAADMIISPSERYFFSRDLSKSYIARGQHDSMLDSSSRIYGVIWGKGIKKNYIYKKLAYNYDFGVTMAAALGLIIPNANGIVLDVFDK